VTQACDPELVFATTTATPSPLTDGPRPSFGTNDSVQRGYRKARGVAAGHERRAVSLLRRVEVDDTDLAADLDTPCFLP